jgi:hypothetical protein
MVDRADGDVAAGRQGGGDGKHQGETSLLTPNLFSSDAKSLLIDRVGLPHNVRSERQLTAAPPNVGLFLP